MSSRWNDGRNKAKNPISMVQTMATTTWNSRWGNGMTCMLTMAEAKGASWETCFKHAGVEVRRVELLNRGDCCGNRLKGTKVYIGKKVCGTVKNPR